VSRYYANFNDEKNRNRSLKEEQKAGGFKCSHCKRWVVINPYMGTANRNHCNMCLWSKHVDIKKGDRQADCQGGMRPIALTFKHEGFGRVGEVMLVHVCCGCDKLSINRIAGDDDNAGILTIFDESRHDSALLTRLEQNGISPLCTRDERELHGQLFGYL
jgi:hypothetical protein